MKLLYSALVYSAILCSSNAADSRNDETKATFNIDEREGDNSFESLSNEAPVNVLIQTKSGRGASSMAFSMSMKINMEIEGTGIIGATVTKRDFGNLQNNRDIVVELDQTLQVVGDPVGNLRKLAEEEPYGIPMVLQNMTFWSSLGEPSGAIKVCVADTGYDRGHEDLPVGNDVTGTSNPNYSSDVWYEDGHGHGTHCSGTVAGIGGNDKGVVGVIPNNADGKFQLVIGNALTGSGTGTGSGVLKAIDTCVANGAKVISLSLGGGAYSSITDKYYKDLYEKQDILFIAAAGNGGSSGKLYPASYPALVSVAAIDSNKNKAGFSQYNNQVEISAPGVSIKSSIPSDKYATWSGTSMATPHVAGVAGLLWMHFPDCTNYEIRNVLAATAEDLKDSGCDSNTGYGLVRAKTAYEMLSQGGCGGNLGQISPVGGCEQLVPVGPTPAPTPECTSNDECDGGDTCSVYTCDNGLCQSVLQCDLCGKAKVQLDITTDKYGGETSYDIKDASNTKVMNGGSYESYKDYSELKCLESGSYKFTIYDTWGDGICCSQGDGSYSIKVSDEEVTSGGNFGNKEEKGFTIGASPPTTPAPVSPPPSTSAPNPAPTTTAPVSPPPSTSAPNPVPTVGPPTPYPTHTPPTQYPTESPPTPYPTHTPPTSQPTVTPPTPHPTGIAPTPFPTGTQPTPFPTHTPPTLFPTSESEISGKARKNSPKKNPPKCKANGEACIMFSECCSNRCHRKKKTCKGGRLK